MRRLPFILNGGIYGQPAVPGGQFAYQPATSLIFNEPWTEYTHASLEAAALPTWTPTNANASFSTISGQYVLMQQTVAGGTPPIFSTAEQKLDLTRPWLLTVANIVYYNSNYGFSGPTFYVGYEFGPVYFLNAVVDFNSAGTTTFTLQCNGTRVGGGSTPVAMSSAVPFAIQMGYDGTNAYLNVAQLGAVNRIITGVPASAPGGFGRRIAIEADTFIDPLALYSFGAMTLIGTYKP